MSYCNQNAYCSNPRTQLKSYLGNKTKVYPLCPTTAESRQAVPPRIPQLWHRGHCEDRQGHCLITAAIGRADGKATTTSSWLSACLWSPGTRTSPTATYCAAQRTQPEKSQEEPKNSSSSRRASFVSLAQAAPHCCFPPVPPFRARRDPNPDNSPVLDQTPLQEQHVNVTDPARSGGCTSLGFSFPSPADTPAPCTHLPAQGRAAPTGSWAHSWTHTHSPSAHPSHRPRYKAVAALIREPGGAN